MNNDEALQNVVMLASMATALSSMDRSYGAAKRELGPLLSKKESFKRNKKRKTAKASKRRNRG